MNIGHKLKDKRNSKRISQQEVAESLSISQRTYSNFESNKSEPSLTQLSKLAEILEFNLLDILQEQGIVFNQNNNEFKDNSNGIVLNGDSDYSGKLKDKSIIIEQQNDIIAMLKEKIAWLGNSDN
ncbi:MAG: helix-turn-helix domain-containing protein [Flavobacteriaceae bacterium]|nr:helix-turn-helix domain-containing protein [Flavobacteriaceae bacterium]